MSCVLYDEPELAERYDRISDLQFHSGCQLAGRMKVKAEDVVLDVGCGTGRLALYLAGLVGPAGQVLGIDPSPHRIRIAQRKLAAGEVLNVGFSLGRGEDLADMPCDSFDHVCYSSVFHWVDDKAAALREAYRVLRPGGAIGITTVDKGHTYAMRHIMEQLFTQKYPGVGFESEMSMLIDAAELRGLLERAGFRDILIEKVAEKHCYASADELYQFMEASSFGNFLREVPDDVRAKIREEMGSMLEKLRTPRGIEIESCMLYALARKTDRLNRSR